MRITIVANPVAGRRGAASLDAPAGALRQAGHDVDVCWSEGAEHCGELAARAAERGAEAVFAAGGDGTISQVMRGVLNTGAALGIIPYGTGNDFCLAAGISQDPLKAARQLAHGRIGRVDVGWVGPDRRPFINIAGIGLDAAVAVLFERLRWPLAGNALGYVAGVVFTVSRTRPAHYRLRIDDAVIETDAWLVPVCNAISYARGMRIAPSARINDGKLDVCVVAGIGRATLLRHLPKVFTGAHVGHPAFRLYEAERVRVEADPPQPVMVDGDPYGQTPMEFGILPGALRMILPAEPGEAET